MGKSSSSIKKKRSKYSHKGSGRTRSKTKRSKSKKLQLCDDSVSYSDFDSRSLVHLSSSSSENSHRKRSSRSCTRKDVKGSRRRAHARSTSSESEDSFCARRKKRIKRNDDFELRKKKYEKKMKKKKRARRDASISSRSSQSWSCSSCQSLGSASSDESEYERLRGRSERRENNKRKLEKSKSGNKWRIYRSRSCSRSRDTGNGDYSSEKKEIHVTASQRLRSVITHRKEDEEERKFHKDEHKEEMMYDYDNYVYCKSLDINDVGNKSQSADQLHVGYKKRSTEDGKREDRPISNIKTARTIESNEVGEDQHARSKPDCCRVGIDDCITEKENKNSGAVDSVNGGDLESILRNKALENLRKFRGDPVKFNTNPICCQNKNDSSVKPLSTSRAELGQIKSSNDGNTRVVPGDSTYSLQNYKKIFDRKNGGNEFSSSKNHVQPHEKVAIGGREKVIVTVDSGVNKPRLVTSALRQALSNATTTPKETPASLELNQAGDISSNKVQDEGKEEDSKFEHRTMSVMRDGEMVQLSYKVYIPKKAPALARRQLKQ